MKNWFNKNYKTIIIAAFLVPIITVAIVSISHVTMWYGISNPITWSVYLSIGIEIAALSALAAISADMGSKVYFPFSIVTLIQFIGNIFFAYSFIDINSQSFKDWVDLVSPLVSFMGVEPTDFVGHKRFLAFFAGGMLPVISLSFLHMLIKFTEEDKQQRLSKDPEPQNKVDASDIISEVSRVRLSENDLKILEKALLNPPSPNEALFKAAENYKKNTDEEILKQAEEIKLKRIFEQSEKIKESREEEPTALANSEYREEVSPESVIDEDIIETDDKIKQREALVKMMEMDQELGLYDDPVDNPLIKEDTYNIAKSIQQPEVVPALSDEEVKEMFMDEWERKFDMVEEEYVPTEEDIILNEELNAIQNAVENETVPEPFVTSEEIQKFNIDSSYPQEEEFNTIENNDSFWRDHLPENVDDDIKKK